MNKPFGKAAGKGAVRVLELPPRLSRGHYPQEAFN